MAEFRLRRYFQTTDDRFYCCLINFLLTSVSPSMAYTDGSVLVLSCPVMCFWITSVLHWIVLLTAYCELMTAFTVKARHSQHGQYGLRRFALIHCGPRLVSSVFFFCFFLLFFFFFYFWVSHPTLQPWTFCKVKCSAWAFCEVWCHSGHVKIVQKFFSKDVQHTPRPVFVLACTLLLVICFTQFD